MARHEASQQAVVDADAALVDIRRQQDQIVSENTNGSEPQDDLNNFFAQFDAKPDLPADAQAQWQELEDRRAAINDSYDQLQREVDQAAEVRTAREDDFRATPDGIGEAVRDAERLARAPVLDLDGTSPVSMKRARANQVRQQLASISKAESRMVSESHQRADAWGSKGGDDQPRRGAFPGGQHVVSGSSPLSRTGLIVNESAMSGSYTNTYVPDPDSQESAGDRGSRDHAIRTSRMELVRENDTGGRERVTIPISTSSAFDDQSAPTVRQTLLSAVGRSEGYRDNYREWARENGYNETDQGWSGSSSYSLGRQAHQEARQVRERIQRFLPPEDYQSIAREARTLAEA